MGLFDQELSGGKTITLLLASNISQHYQSKLILEWLDYLDCNSSSDDFESLHVGELTWSVLDVIQRSDFVFSQTTSGSLVRPHAHHIKGTSTRSDSANAAQQVSELLIPSARQQVDNSECYKKGIEILHNAIISAYDDFNTRFVYSGVHQLILRLPCRCSGISARMEQGKAYKAYL
jgi:hypothetical protein